MLKVFIRERRMEKHMTQKQLAEKLVNKVGKPLNQGELSRYEKGKVDITLDLILQIAEILECKVEDLASR